MPPTKFLRDLTLIINKPKKKLIARYVVMFSQNSQSLRQTPNSSFYIRDILGADSGPNGTPEKYPEYGPRGGQALVGYPPGPYTSHVMAHQSLVPSSRAYPLPFTGRGKYHYTFYLNVKMTIFWNANFFKNKNDAIRFRKNWQVCTKRKKIRVNFDGVQELVHIWFWITFILPIVSFSTPIIYKNGKIRKYLN